MTIARCRPIMHLFNPENQIERMFGRLSRHSFNHHNGGVWSPYTDVAETKDSLIFSIELPGMRKEDLKITVENGILTIEGEKRMNSEEKDDKYIREERWYGKISRSFLLPATIQTEQIRANFENGLLKLVLPKVEAAKPKEIAVNAG